MKFKDAQSVNQHLHTEVLSRRSLSLRPFVIMKVRKWRKRSKIYWQNGRAQLKSTLFRRNHRKISSIGNNIYVKRKESKDHQDDRRKRKMIRITRRKSSRWNKNQKS
mmetsp:Transcript_21342/g.29921  ORF Transcript_21342/g.29921 Transcript_21342/m.29921 type:complete len:107 (-) Transcript_21342:385-705(-)